MSTPNLLLASVAVTLALTLPSPALAGADSPPPAAARNGSDQGHAHQHQAPIYVCPMHPQVVRDAPGTCPICGMTLVEQRVDDAGPPPTDASAANADPASGPPVTVSPAIVQALGVRTTPVAREALSKHIRTLGRIAYDETRLVHVHPRAEGWIESLAVRSEGAPVQRDQELASLYAPRILNAQVDFLLALSQPKEAAPVKVDKARNLLRLLDLPDDVIRELERTREPRNTVPVRAPMDGVVTGLMARDGMYVTEATEMFTIADLSRVWVLVDVFEDQLDWLAPKLTAVIRVPARPGRTWEGQVDYLYPELDPKTRTLKVRLVFPNPDGALKPNMFADVEIQGTPQPGLLTIPTEALIQTGERESVVKALGDGRFAPVDVKTGMRSGNRVEITEGLAEGDAVVVSGQFLIDSESSLRASFRRMGDGDAGPAPAPAHQH
ncbi:MAG TPA: efflux RND transporter periplasmic adaptor subunit [Lamprocystis sp. (in: g-proteobacteria)]|nr:efflux RND transporter periplasmic adaptor subunit [Lamprocystis sp. (in: g-proteobacteria)]